MITLYGFAISNYYNKVKLVLLEKGIPFQEQATWPSQEETLLQQSPLGKIPFIKTEQGNLSESQVILEYLEDAYPNPPLYPANPFARAKNREFIQHLEVNLELQARKLYGEAFFGRSVAKEVKDEAKIQIEKGLAGINRLMRFSPYVLGESFTLADCAAWVNFRLISAATQTIYGEDLVEQHVVGLADYLHLLESRPTVRQVAADRETALRVMAEQTAKA